MGTKHGNLHQLSVTMSRVIYLTLRTDTGTDVSHTSTGKTRESYVVVEKNEGEWTGRVQISKEEISGSRRSMHGYSRTCQAFKGEPLSSEFSTDGSLIFASTAPHCVFLAKENRQK